MMNAVNKLLLLAIGLLAAGCYYDSQEALYNNVVKKTCDTTNVTYSGKVAPIITKNCSSCHSAANGPLSGSGVVLDNYDDLSLYAGNGMLIGDITWAPGHNPMPQSGGKLDDCDIAIIQHWIDLNTPDN